MNFPITLLRGGNMKTSNIVVAVAVVSVIAYTVAAFILQFAMGVEISPTLTTCWYSFWGVELAALATIKNTKTKCHYEESEDMEE